MQVLVTGASGFVGKNLLGYLADDARFQLQPRSIRNGDLFGFSANGYVHLAGKAHDLKNSSSDEEYMQINYELTRALYDHFIQDAQAQCFVFISSIKAAADAADDQVITEETNGSVAGIYGLSKRKAEKYILAHMPTGAKRVYILRPCMIHGPGNKGNLNLLYKFTKLGIPYPLAAYENQRSFLTVENLCFVIRELLEREDIPSGIYNVSDGAPLSTIRVFSIISEGLGRKPRLMKISKRLINMLARVGDNLHLPFNSARLRKLTENYIVSNLKLTAALGRSLPVDAETGLRKTIDFFIQ